MRLNYFDYFRGLAIIFIVAGHCRFPWKIDSFPEIVAANLILGGTALFVFISGFFFHHVFFLGFKFRKFLLKKIENVFLPYLILSGLAFVVLVIVFNKHHPYVVGSTESISGIIFLYLKYLWTGRILDGYWYIPAIMIIFLMSPLFIKYILLPSSLQLCIFFTLIVVSMFVHRPLYNISVIHSVIYFIPVYMLGIIYSINEGVISKFLNGKELLLGLGMVALASIQAMSTDSYGSYHKADIFSYNGLDLIIVQKIVMIFFIISTLKKIKTREIWILKSLASTSFGVYFLHPWILTALHSISFFQYYSFVNGGLLFVLTTVMVMTISIALTTLFSKVLGRRSRYIIGY